MRLNLKILLSHRKLVIVMTESYITKLVFYLQPLLLLSHESWSDDTAGNK